MFICRAVPLMGMAEWMRRICGKLSQLRVLWVPVQRAATASPGLSGVRMNAEHVERATVDLVT